MGIMFQLRRITLHNIHWRIRWSWLFIKYGQFPKFFGKRPFWYRCDLGWFSCPDFWTPSVFSYDHEPAVSDLIGELRGSVFVDVGANAGKYTVMAARNGNRVIAIEPSPETASALRQTVKKNNLDDLVTVVEAAASDYDGVSEFEIATDSTVSHLSGGRRDDPNILIKSKVQVKVLKLDSLIVGEKPGLIKIDVEGMDASVLRGARRLIAEGVPVTFEALNNDYYQECAKELGGRHICRLDERNYYAP